MLGGSSSINVMAFTRGDPGDYDRWAQKGARGWSYADVLPYFKRVESWQDGESEYRGADGPIGVRMGEDAGPAVHRLDRGRAHGRPAGHRRLQRRAGGGLRPRPVLDPQRPALLGRGRRICGRR